MWIWLDDNVEVAGFCVIVNLGKLFQVDVEHKAGWMDTSSSWSYFIIFSNSDIIDLCYSLLLTIALVQYSVAKSSALHFNQQVSKTVTH